MHWITCLQAKIHRATVTAASLDYEGSITLDAFLLEQTGILPFQQVHVYNIATGSRFETYAMQGEAKSGTIQVNGAAAHLAKTGDKIIIAAYVQMSPSDAAQHQPILLFVDEANRPRHRTLPDVTPLVSH